MIRLIIAITGALILDALIGDPTFSCHPVRLLGNLASSLERLRSNVCKPSHLCLIGAVVWGVICIVAFGVAWLLSYTAGCIHPFCQNIADILVVWASIAPSDLARHAGKVRRALKNEVNAEPKKARKAVSMIVGRDVSKLDATAIARACVESVAESSIDAAAAPLFWAIFLFPWIGPAGAFLYRAINTMDSMFGYENESYLHFGFVSARADDLANLIPARLSSLIACLVAPCVGGSASEALRAFMRYRLAHKSPNAGHPEATYAGALGIKLGGPNFYVGGLVNKPWIYPEGGNARADDIQKAVYLMYIQTVFSVALFLAPVLIWFLK
ncbi:MAG: adenosylcobinamide-phosphate synthase CbiB [Treponemataceae bacterium]